MQYWHKIFFKICINVYTNTNKFINKKATLSQFALHLTTKENFKKNDDRCNFMVIKLKSTAAKYD